MAAPTIAIRLLGDFSLACDGRLIDEVNTPRLQSLIAYLALHRDAPQLRQQLAFLFWPDSSEGQARNNLRQLLHALRRALPSLDDLLVIDNRTLQWRHDVVLHLDVDDFERACASVEQANQRENSNGAQLYAAEEQVIERYQADLLPGCYDDWIIPARERLRERLAQTLNLLINFHETQHDFTAAIHCARRLLLATPLNEDTYRTLMRLLALSGNRTAALQVYQTCAATLKRELQIAPSQATEDLYRRLLRQDAEPAFRSDTPRAPDALARQPPVRTPALVGRRREWATLSRAWQDACAVGPGFALITGEAGIGKSRLASELAHWAAQAGATIALARSYAVEGRLSFAPVIEWLRSDALRPHVRRLEPMWLTEVARVLPELLTELADAPHYGPLDEFGQRQRFFQALALAVLAAPQPLLLVMDDLQWCDQETLEWLHFLLRFDPGARLLIVGSARDDEALPPHPLQTTLRHLRHTVPVTEIALAPLDAAETAELAAQMMNRELDTPSAMRLFGETEGNPLFVVEAVRAGLDDLLARRVAAESAATLESAQTLATQALPAGVRTVISGRLAQLSAPARELAAVAAMVGREFTLDILTQIGYSDEESIVRALDELWQRRIVSEKGTGAYDFTHDKLREIAYTEISAPQRHLWHRRIARALETLYAANLDPASGQIAVHYEHGGSIERALPYYQRAALVAQRVFAHEDAIRLLRHCLVLLEQLPNGATRDQQELDILLGLAPLYRITRGWTAPELEEIINRTLALCDTVGDDDQRAGALYGQQSLLVVQGQLERVQLVAEELHALYRHRQETAPPLSDMMLAGTQLHLGRLIAANDAFERVLAVRDSQQTERLEESQGWNYAVHTRAWQAHALWLLGHSSRAISSGGEAIELAQRFQLPFNQALATTYLATLWQMIGDVAMARQYATEALQLTKEYKAPYYHVWAAILVSYAHARAQPDEAHIAALRMSIEEFVASGARLRLPYYLALLAQVYGLANRPGEGLAAIEEGLAHARNSNERCWDAELHRIRCELMLASGQDARDAEAAVTRAVTLARRQHARALELRALLTLARLRPAGKQGEQTRQALRDVYAEYTEGFETPDLQAARALLAGQG
ncbi:MAG TPA: AAA family ATPase [Ktedonobacterales bacterium]|nr:AAA family ATPase [Ktedonobacterales bacterium]